MKLSLIQAGSASALFLFCVNLSEAQINYPRTHKVNQEDNYFGTKVSDPYRWLEDDNSAETAAWVKQQNAITEDYLAKIPFRKKVKERMTALWNFPKQTTPSRGGNKYFYYSNNGLQNQFVLNKVDSDLKSRPMVLIDPNTLSADGTTSLNAYSVSKDGKYIAYNISKGGSDWNEINIKRTDNGEILNEKIEWVKFSGLSWRGNGFYYSRYDDPGSSDLLKGKNQFHKVYYHRLGTLQAEDELIFEDKEHPLRNFGAGVTDDEKYLIVYASEGSHGQEVSIKKLDVPSASFTTLHKGFENIFTVAGNDSNWMYVYTNMDAPRYKLIAVNASNPSETKVLIPENKDVLQQVAFGYNMMVTHYMKDASSLLKVFDKQGNMLYDLLLPSIGSINELSADVKDETFFYSFTSYTMPATIYGFNLKTQLKTQVFKPAIDFDEKKYETRLVFYPSKDGTRIPMFLTHKKGMAMDGNNPVLLFGYGGFNVSKNPEFKIERLVFIENGGVFAAPCLRGGGEYGEAWHEAGTKLKKQNVFDDFIAAAEYLISEKYTNPSKLAIGGRSNGGLLVGACMTQRPDLFKVAVPTVGVMDMLRYHKFTIGWAWKGDYGSSEDEINFKNLYAYSPLHTLRPGKNYPATLVITGDHDDRVVPAHSFKFIATLQEKYKGPNPQLIRIDINSGHASTTITGSSKPVDKQIDEFTDVFSFTMFNLGMNMK